MLHAQLSTYFRLTIPTSIPDSTYIDVPVGIQCVSVSGEHTFIGMATANTDKDDWTEEKCVQLIREYRARPILWDAQDALFFKKTLKPEAWEGIAKKLNFPAYICKHKMIVLMSSFRREKAKIMNSIKHGDSSKTYKSTWFAFKELAFLMDKRSERKRQNTGVDFDDDPEDEAAPSVKKTILKHHLDATRKRLSRSLVSNRLNSEAEAESQDYQMQETIRPALVTMTPETSIRDSEDEIKSFTNFLASKMKRYTETTKNAVQQAICEVIFKADQHFYEPTTTSPPPLAPISPKTYSSQDSSSPPPIASISAKPNTARDPFFQTMLIDNEADCETIVIKQDYSDSD